MPDDAPVTRARRSPRRFRLRQVLRSRSATSWALSSTRSCASASLSFSSPLRSSWRPSRRSEPSPVTSPAAFFVLPVILSSRLISSSFFGSWWLSTPGGSRENRDSPGYGSAGDQRGGPPPGPREGGLAPAIRRGQGHSDAVHAGLVPDAGHGGGAHPARGGRDRGTQPQEL